MSVRTTFDLPLESFTSRYQLIIFIGYKKIGSEIVVVIMLDKGDAEEDSIEIVLSLVNKDVQCVLLRQFHQGLQSVFEVAPKSEISDLVSDNIRLL